jgi:hypothetical protein
MINEDNIDAYIDSETRNNMMLSQSLERAKEHYEKMKYLVEDSAAEIKGLYERKESFKN